MTRSRGRHVPAKRSLGPDRSRRSRAGAAGPDVGTRAPKDEHTPSVGDHATLRRMFGRDLIYVFGAVLPLAISALLLPALTRLMGTRQFGIVSLAVAISAVMYIVLTFSLQTAVQREYPGPGGDRRARGLVAISSVCIVVLAFGLAASAHSWAGVVGASGFPWALEIISLWSGGAAIVLVCLGYFRAADRLTAFLVVVLTQSVGSQLVGIALLLSTEHSAHQYLIGLLIGQVVAAVIALALVRPSLSGAVKMQHLKRSLTFSLPLVPNQLATYFLWSGDRIVVQRDLGSSAQARYAVAYAVGAVAINVISQLSYAWVPRIFAIQDVTQRRRVLAQVQERLLSILAPAVIAIAFAVPFLLVIASPKSYDPRSLGLVTLLIVPTALPYSVSVANARTLLAHGRTSRLALSSCTCAALNMVLNVLWVPILGITGSALATLLAYACLSWLSGLVIRSRDDRLPNRLRTEMFVWIVAGACVATELIPNNAFGTAGRAVGLSAALAALAIAFRRLHRPHGSQERNPVPVTSVVASSD